MFGLRPLFVEVSNRYHDWLLRNVQPLCPGVPKWVLRRRQFNTGKWY